MVESKIMEELFTVLKNRKHEMPEGSYTVKLFQEGQDKILAKIKEETEEVIEAANVETNKRIVEESSDLIYHLLVLLAYKDIRIESVFEELKKRRK